MRFYTVPDARTARTSVGYATAFIGFFYLLTFILGFGAMVIIGRDAITAVDAGGNMAAPLLAEGVGGTPFLGFISAVAFATILAVVAGLTLSGAATLSHDLWVNVVRGAKADQREQLVVARIATVLLADRLDRARHRVQGTERRVHGGAGVRHCGEREFPGARAVDLLEPADDSRRAEQHDRRHCLGAAADLPVADDSDGHPRTTPARGSRCETPASCRSRCRSSSRSACRCCVRCRPKRSASRSSSGSCISGSRVLTSPQGPAEAGHYVGSSVEAGRYECSMTCQYVVSGFSLMPFGNCVMSMSSHEFKLHRSVDRVGLQQPRPGSDGLAHRAWTAAGPPRWA